MQNHAHADSQYGCVDPSDDLTLVGHHSPHWAGGKSAAIRSLSVKSAPDSPKLTPGVYKVRTLAELDALAASHVSEEAPLVYWEDCHARFRFETLPEALEALRDPLIQGFLPREQLATTVIEEIHEFPPYTACFSTAWKLVEKLAHLPFNLERRAALWTARFGSFDSPETDSAPVAICLAALKTKGLEIHVTR